MHIRQFGLMVKDLEESIEFYETITELTISRRFKAGEGEIAYMTNGKGETEIELICMPEKKVEGNGFFIGFVTEKLDYIHGLAISKGLNPTDIRNPDEVSRYFYVYDPNGVSIQMRQKF
jgi:lactoylglutathione lyase